VIEHNLFVVVVVVVVIVVGDDDDEFSFLQKHVAYLSLMLQDLTLMNLTILHCIA
jgi:hypothetical protein